MILEFLKFRNKNQKSFLNSKNVGVFFEIVNSDPFHPNDTPTNYVINIFDFKKTKINLYIGS